MIQRARTVGLSNFFIFFSIFPTKSLIQIQPKCLVASLSITSFPLRMDYYVVLGVICARRHTHFIG